MSETEKYVDDAGQDWTQEVKDWKGQSMSETGQHTSGPWGIFDMEGGPGITGNALEADVMIADLRSADTPADQTEANARLIAAAPSLLSALRHAETYLEHPDVQAIPFALPASNALRIVREALALAEGGKE